MSATDPYKRMAPYAVVIGMFAALSIVLAFSKEPETDDSAGIGAVLPEHVGEWTGHNVYFCQSEHCMRGFAADELAQTGLCPVCGGALVENWSFGERNMLPADTGLDRKEYSHPVNRRLHAALVVSGRERVSIHRPEICMVSQGYHIAGSQRVPIRLNDGRTLDVTVLSIQPERSSGNRPMFFAYWFASAGVETPSHLERMRISAWDRVFHNRTRRWAYIAVSGPPGGSSSDGLDDSARDFIRRLHDILHER